MFEIRCQNCQSPYPDQGVPYLCPLCGGVYDWAGLPDFDRTRSEMNLPGIWKYRHAYGLASQTPMVTLGEGNTPIIDGNVEGQKVSWKLEYLNPTGSYKDRGSAVLVSFLISRKVRAAVEDSSGNAGASFAAYAARGGINAKVFVPSSAAGPKRAQIEAYGAELASIAGPRSAAADAVRKEVERGAIYASHAFLPFGMIGIATIAYEIVEQMRAVPGTIISPVGHGSLLLGTMRGFAALKQCGEISKVPVFIGVQAKACAPVWAAFHKANTDIEEGQTLAEGVRVRNPVRGKAIIAEMTSGLDQVIAIEEEKILPARDQLARKGLFVEPTSAMVWDAILQTAGKAPEPIVVLLTGSGFKYNR